jgi:hypothetical protein
MYLNILSREQQELLAFLDSFKGKYILVGGTAIALQIGHRKSIDFDLFSTKPIKKNEIKKAVAELKFSKQLLFEDADGIHYLINNVKVTFFYYPFNIKAEISVTKNLQMPSLLTLAAMKFYAMGKRAKWKDYVDIHLLLKNHFSIQDVGTKAIELFEDGYAEKLFRQQLSYFEDIDYTETVEWIANEINDQTIKKELTEFSLQF